MRIRNREDLITFLNQEKNVKFVLFWGHQKAQKGVTKSCFSQWHEAEFEIDGWRYSTAEHYMMAEKAKLFGDVETYKKILATRTPGEAQMLGRSVSGYNDEAWTNCRFEIVVRGNFGKFSQNAELGKILLNTGGKILVEASPMDKIWGIGLSADNPAAENPNLWQGQNLLGFALMEVRHQLAKENP